MEQTICLGAAQELASRTTPLINATWALMTWCLAFKMGALIQCKCTLPNSSLQLASRTSHLTKANHLGIKQMEPY